MGSLKVCQLLFKWVGISGSSDSTRKSKNGRIVFSSEAGAAEYQGDLLGEFQERGNYNGRKSYVQQDNVGRKSFFLYYHSQGVWLVGPTLGGTRNHLQNPSDSTEPPSSGWGYWGRNRTFLDFDPTLTLQQGVLEPCKKVEVEGNEKVRSLQESSLGTYKPNGLWSEGRPVYEREREPHYYLLIKEGLAGWTVKDSLNATGSRISGGRGTNVPGPESGRSVRYGQSDWKWFNARIQEWVEGGVSVTCHMK